MHESNGSDRVARRAIRLAAAITLYQGHVLIVRRSQREGFLPGVWGVPCGKVDPGENPRQAAVRELKEETGVDGEVIEFVGESHFDSHWRGKQVRNIQSNYLISATGPFTHKHGAHENDSPKGQPPDVSLPEEDQRYKWVPAGNIESANLDAHNLGAIRQGLSKVLSLATEQAG